MKLPTIAIYKEYSKGIKNNHVFLTRAQIHADAHSTCCKVKVGSLIISENYEMIFGCNHGIERNCEEKGCRRVEVYGENSKLHRLPSDCVSVHSEVDAICKAAKTGINLSGAVIFVTRYPCEACARAIALSGIRRVVYGRKEEVSEMTKSILDSAGVQIIHESDWIYEDNNS